ncbi:hypothetical protein [Paraburkholderia sp.]|uniref:hypothetical protein n=1 Tax=Paraburkholderia sp. TaxID=1926495 RepID=UPI00238DDB24|nr:hypothetical protein [Paraburkholderia sp.]MDE1182854.1 hypothetical protein [Paraburkholderia sp.]
MDRQHPVLACSFQATLIDQDLTHIARVMRAALVGDLGGAILPTAYWRRRLHGLLDARHLSKAQLCTVDSLLLQLDRFDTDSSAEWHAPPPFSAPPPRRRTSPSPRRISR